MSKHESPAPNIRHCAVTLLPHQEPPKLEDCRANFRGKDGAAFVVRCPSCRRENWAMAVASGQCAWCGWTENSVVTVAPLAARKVNDVVGMKG